MTLRGSKKFFAFEPFDPPSRPLLFDSLLKLTRLITIIDDEEFDEPMTLDEATAMEQMENAAPKSKKKKKKKRRRSSAKFLRLSEKFDIEGDDENDVMNDDKLGEMYSKAVGMSQANKINAQNSWSLNLIDNIDRIINGPLNSPAPKAKKNKGASGAVEKKKKNGFGNDDDADYEPSINFAKASCTLDASVKIWSYRVDDVHTSSYKVLANLNRTDNDNEEKKVAKVGERKQVRLRSQKLLRSTGGGGGMGGDGKN